VFALIEQPLYGFGDPLVWVPFLAGLLLLGAFVWHEHRSDHPMLPLSLFRSRNFAVGNLATLGIYGGLGGALFFVTIFLQQVAGYTAIEAGLSLMPITIVMWLLSRRWGALSDRIGPRLLMGCGPLVAGLGLIWMGRLSPDVEYLTDLLPAVLVFAVGLSATVAPLTNTVLGAVPQHHAGVASGVNNQVARVASLLAIAVLGAVASAEYKSSLREDAAALPPPQRAAALRYEEEVLADGRGRPAPVRAAVQDASVSAYRLGLGVGGGLVMLGGVVALLGIVNPRRAERDCAEELGHGPARLQHPCVEPQKLPVVKLPQRAAAAAPE
jgi:hypothetical protein